jgi:hypothetical protein
VNSGGFIGAGNAPATPGTITVGSLTLNGGGTYTWDFGNTSGTAGTHWDLLSVSNDLTINATSGNKFTVAINGTPTGWAPSTSQTWNIINYGSLANASDASAVAFLVEGLEKLNARLEVPRIRDFKGATLKVFEAALEKMASDALASGSPANNPVVPIASEIVQLYREAR